MNKIINKKKKAFTLIELIIVLAIMAIIAAIAIPNFTAVRENSKTKADTQSCENIKKIALMSLADQAIAEGTKTFDVAVSGAGVVTATGTPPVGTEGATLAIALKDVKAPQAKALTYTVATGKYAVAASSSTTAIRYTIDIDASGNVIANTVATAAAVVTP